MDMLSNILRQQLLRAKAVLLNQWIDLELTTQLGGILLKRPLLKLTFYYPYVD